ncbi:hypothetical protein DQ384_38095 [Sphaerisporangium album]|uniref:XRE family transcriptional regulator n=2 Tax=Sphaerisporangium album TaxID=509200 RepID=A0A367EM02_9ACTN|nr:hypothetical protein DQ384_38095 [Sphaerisporangium album]
MLRSILTAGGTLPFLVLDELDQIRGRMDALLASSSISAATLDRWEETVHGYAYGFKSRPPRQLLEDVLLDFAELHQHAASRQPVDHQTRLCRLSAQLAGMAGNILADLGHHRHARRWFSTAQIAADETGDRFLKAWVRAREATVSLYHHQPPQTAIALAGEARQWAGQAPCAGAALAAATEARAYARLGDAARGLEALRQAQAITEKLPDAHLENSIFGYPRQQMAFHLEATLTAIGRVKEARQAQREALALYPPTEHVNPALIRLDEASCLIRSGDPASGYQLAGQHLLAMPEGYRTPLVLSRAHELLDTSRPGHRGAASYDHYRETLSTLTTA